MAHLVKNIMSFDGFDRDFAELGFGGTTTPGAPPFARTGPWSALQLGQQYCRIPLSFAASGIPEQGVVRQAAEITRVYVGVFFVMPFTPATALMNYGTTPGAPVIGVRVEIDPALELSLNGVKSGTPTTLVANTHYCLELRRTSTIAELRIDGVPEVAVPGPFAGGHPDFYQIGDERVGASGLYGHDDLLIEAHRTNAANIDWPGPGACQVMIPNADGTDLGWAPVGAANRWQCVDDPFGNDGDVTYVLAPGAPADVTFELTNVVIPVGEEIRAVRPASIVRVSAGVGNWKFVRTRSGIAIRDTTPGLISPPAYGGYGADCIETDPATGITWTQAGIDAMEAGIGMFNAGIGRNTKLAVEVAHGPPFPAGRAKLNPNGLGGPVEMLNPSSMGA